jgi:hypothetical protein
VSNAIRRQEAARIVVTKAPSLTALVLKEFLERGLVVVGAIVIVLIVACGGGERVWGKI